jgi:hypothetical protein
MAVRAHELALLDLREDGTLADTPEVADVIDLSAPG